MSSPPTHALFMNSGAPSSPHSHNIFSSVTSPTNWSEQDVKAWLHSVGFEDLARVSEDHGLDGTVLLNLDLETLKDLGISKVGRKLRLMRLINKLNNASEALYRNDHHESRNGDYEEYLDGGVWAKFNWQNNRIKALEDQLWELKELTKSLRERTDSLVSFNSSWAAQSSMNSEPYSSRRSTDNATPTEPITASSFRVTAPNLSADHTLLNVHNSLTSTPSEFGTEYQTTLNYETADSSASVSSTGSSHKAKWRRSVSQPNLMDNSVATNEVTDDFSSPEGQPGGPLREETNLSTLNDSENQKSSLTASLSNPWSRKAGISSSQNTNRQSTHSLIDLRRKFSESKLDGTFKLGHFNEPGFKYKLESANIDSGTLAGRENFLSRRDFPATMALKRSVSQRSNNHRAGLLIETPPLSAMNLQDEFSALKSYSSTTKLALSRNMTGKLGIIPNNLPNNTETSIRVKSNSEQTVLEVLANHLSNFYAHDSNAWTRHVLIVRMRNMREYCLSYDDIPLKVYRTLKSREGVDFAIRSTDELPSPLRMASSSSRRDLGFNLEEESISSDKMKNADGNNTSHGELETDRIPLAFGLAIRGHYAENEDELSINPGQSFRIKSHSHKRYLVERDGSLSNSPLFTAGQASNSTSPSMNLGVNEENSGWVPESCILESTKSIRLLTSNESSLKHLLSKPIDDATKYLELKKHSTLKVALIGFQSHHLNWSGELTSIVQGERLRAFNHKTRAHWTYCLRESNGERGWFPSWILSSNVQLFPLKIQPGTSAQNKLQAYLLKQQYSSVMKPRMNMLESGKVLLARSASSVSSSQRPAKINSAFSASTGRDIKAAAAINSESRSGSPANGGFVANKSPKNLDSDDKTPPDEASLKFQNLFRSATDASRSRAFTARKRRSRISPIIES